MSELSDNIQAINLHAISIAAMRDSPLKVREIEKLQTRIWDDLSAFLHEKVDGARESLDLLEREIDQRHSSCVGAVGIVLAAMTLQIGQIVTVIDDLSDEHARLHAMFNN